MLLLTNLDTRFVEQLHLDDHDSTLMLLTQSLEVISVLAGPSTGHDFRVWQRQDLQQTRQRDESMTTQLAWYVKGAERKLLTCVQNSRPMPLVAPVTAQTVLAATIVKMRSEFLFVCETDHFAVRKGACKNSTQVQRPDLC